MRSIPQLLAGAITLSAVLTSPLHAQCLAADSTSAALIRSVTKMATSTDSTVVLNRQDVGIPAVPASQISLVTTKSVCSKAVQAAAAGFTRSDGVLPSASAYVVKVGTTYVVADPAQTMGEYAMTVVLTSQYQVVSRFMR